jgi:hypothetical protein
MAIKEKDPAGEVHVMTVERGAASFHIVGTAPMFQNCMSQKAMQELLLPSGRKTDADKKANLKHQPMNEYRDSVYFDKNTNGPTYIQHLSSAFRGAMRTAALDLPGVSKAEVGRLMWVENERVSIFGVPQMDMRIVRQAGMNRAPDVRTRCILPEWACSITVSYVMPQLKLQSVSNLLAAAGMSIGVGDYRNEKGSGNFGLFRIASQDDLDYQRIVKTGGRKVQVAAMEDPEFYNEETERLYHWFEEAVKTHRTFAPAKTANANGKGRNGKGSPTFVLPEA